jgi:hypothetical protein
MGKDIVEATLERFGYRRPRWYATLKHRVTALTGDLDTLARAATHAGLADIEVRRIDVDAGLDQPERAIEWRLHMPHTLDFVASLPPRVQAALRAHAMTARTGPSVQLPAHVPILTLHAHVPPNRGTAGPASSKP